MNAHGRHLVVLALLAVGAASVLVGLLPATAPPRAGAQATTSWSSAPVCVERVSVSSTGQQADAESLEPSLSDDGLLVTFGSLAGNLTPDDSNANWDIHLRDRRIGQTELVGYSADAALDGTFGAGDGFLAGDGRTVAYVARRSHPSPISALAYCSQGPPIPSRECVLLFDLAAGTIEVLDVRPDGTRGDGYSRWPALAANGSIAAFWSTSTDLVTGDTNAKADVFARNRPAGVTERDSVTTFSAQGTGASGDVGVVGADSVAVSRDGRYVAFGTVATNLVPGDTNGYLDVLLRDRPGGTTERVSLGAGYTQGNGASALGARQAISDDGRYVVFVSSATNLVTGDTNGRMDVFVRDRTAGTTERISVPDAGGQGNGDSGPVAAISADGRYVAFASAATNLVTGDTNAAADIFVRDRVAGRTIRVSVPSDGLPGGQADQASATKSWQGLSIAANGLAVAFQSAATNLVSGDTNGKGDIFVAEPCGARPTPTANPYPGPTETSLPPTITPSPMATRTATTAASRTPTTIATATATVALTATRTPQAYPGPATATPTATTALCVCTIVRQRVPAVVIADAVANPSLYYGWRYPLNLGRPPGPGNPLRTCLSLQNRGVDYHPLWNKPIWRVGCP